MADQSGVGFTHLSVPVSSLDRSIPFYESYGGLRLVAREPRSQGADTAALADGAGSFILVLAETPHLRPRLEGRAHLGVGCESREEVDRRAGEARSNGFMVGGPVDAGGQVGYHAFLVDPDGHQLELAYGQEVGLSMAASG